MTAPTPQSVYTRGSGTTSTGPFITIIENRAPTGNDGINQQLQVGQRWIDTSTNNNEWFLLGFTSTGGVVQADWVQIAGGGLTIETLTGNSGGAVGPTANNINIVGDGTSISVAGNPGTSTLTISEVNQVAKYPITPYVVGPSGQAGYQTIQSAINAANTAGGGMVFIQPGSYTESLTLYTGIQLSGPSEQSVTITGVHTLPASGTFNANRLTFASATNIFSSTAAGTTAIIIEDCSLNATNGYSFNLPNWTGSLQLFNIGNIGTNDGGINNTGGMSVYLYEAGLGNGTSHSMILSGSTIFGDAISIGCPINLETGATLLSSGSYYNFGITLSNNSKASFNQDIISTGSSAAITQSSTGTLSLYNVVVESSHNPAIAGAGTGTVTLNSVIFASNTAISGSLTVATTGAWYPPGNISTSGYVLTSNGTGSVPTWQANPGSSSFSAAAITVSPTAGQGNYTTIGAALSAATSGQTILIKEGTYTENPALVAGVNLVAWEANALTPTVTIVGKCTFSSAGTVSISGIQLQTNSDYFLSVTGTAASVVNLDNCYLNSLNHTGIQYSSSGAGSGISVTNSSGNVATTGIANFAASGVGYISFNYTTLGNNGSSTTADTISSGTLVIDYSEFNTNITTSSTASAYIYYMLGSTCALTLGGSGVNQVFFSNIVSSAASAISIGSGATAQVAYCRINSSNTHAITGVGTLQYCDLTFVGSSSNINTSTVTQFSNGLPFTVANGGTGVASTTAYAPICGGTTTTGAFQAASTGLSTSGYVLTSNGGSALPSFQAASASGAVTLVDGDSGNASPSGGTITISGGTSGAIFTGSSATLTESFNFLALPTTTSTNGQIKINGMAVFQTYGTNNLFVGQDSGNFSLSTSSGNTGAGAGTLAALTVGVDNLAVGYSAGSSITSGFSNTFVGFSSGSYVTSGSYNTGVGNNSLSTSGFNGSYNVCVGDGCGTNYVGTESSNILFGNTPGTAAESNVIRIGTQGSSNGQQNACYIAGVAGATISAGSPTPYLTLCDASDGQIVALAPLAANTATSTFGSIVVGTALQNTASYPILVNVSMAVTAATGATILVGVGATNSPTAQTIVASFSVAETVSFSFAVPSKYYAKVTTTGTITVGSITTFVSQIG